MKEIRIGFYAGFLFLLCLQKMAFADTNDGMVLYFPFDEAPVAGVVKDESGNGNNGTVSGAVFVDGGGRVGGAYRFDGIDDFISIVKNASLNVGSGPGLTISAWYNTSGNTQSPLVEWSPGFQGVRGKAGVHMWANTEGFQWHPPTNPGGGGTGANLVAAGIPFPENETNYVIGAADQPRNEWHQVAVTYDRASEVARVYVDGRLGQECRFAITPDTNYGIYLGLRPTDSQRLMGLLDEVRIYNRALNEQEALALYDAVTLGRVYQNFDGDSNPDNYGWIWDPAGVKFSMDDQNFHSRPQSFKIVSTVNEGGVGIKSKTETWDFNAQSNRHDRLTFWIWADPQNPHLAQQEPNTVSVKFFDTGTYQANGFEIWTTKMADVRTWTQLTVLFTQLPSDFKFDHINKIEFKNFWPGAYYLDDIQMVAGDRIYQTFENDRKYREEFEPAPRTCSAADPNSAGNCGWAWFGNAVLDNQIVFDGQQSWKLNVTDFFGGTGLRSQEKRLCMPGQCPDVTDSVPQQNFWHVDLNPAHLLSLGYDRLTFWLYSSGENGMDNNLGVQFFDWGNYHADPIPNGFYDKQVIWARKGGTDGRWTQLSIPLEGLPADFKLTDINKLQLQTYWPGTYYLDGIKAAKPVPIIDQAVLPTGVVAWTRSVGAGQYRLQESPDGIDENSWNAIYAGTANTYTFTPPRLSKTWLRVRWETIPNETGIEPYTSDWSDAVNYIAQPVLLRQASLQQGWIELKPIPQAARYEIQQAGAKNGSWTQVYQGPVPSTPLTATQGRWYRARAIVEDGSGQIIDSGDFGPALLYKTNGFVKAVSTVLREQNGSGDVITLRGTNLGNALLIEPWMFFGLNHPAVKKPGDRGYDPNVAVPDDWMFRDQLTQRFGPTTAAGLIKSYQDTYLQDIDFNNLLRLGVNVVRLPVYYRDMRELDANLNWLGSGYKFDHIDRLVEFCADRGLYVLLDLHGAPGNQSEQDNSGRKDFNKLFKEDQPVVCSGSNVTIGECYRRRTEDVWKAIAAHYKNNTAVVGYDLLNEPAGVSSPTVLRQMYDRLYKAIRSLDSNHLIVMEGLWVDRTRWPSVANDWDWLPNPKTYNWTNIAYQFHYYCWDCVNDPDPAPNDPDINAPPVPVAAQITRQRGFLDAKFADADTKQFDYDVPIMIGEFTGFGVRPVWEDYLNRFNQHGWSWVDWSYKTHDSPSEWGLYTHMIFNKDISDVRHDSLEEIQRKLKLYDTSGHHIPNVSLTGIFKTYTAQAVNQPPILNPIGSKTVNEGQALTFTLTSSDANGDGVMYSAAPLPSGASLDAVTGKFSWTPGFNQAGTYNATFAVRDGVLKDQEKITITVKNAAMSVSSSSDSPDPFSPNGDGRSDTTTIKATLNHAANWTLEIKTSSGSVVRAFSGNGTSVNQIWDGKNSSNARVPDGIYTYVLTATDVGGSAASRSSQVTVNTMTMTLSSYLDD